MGFLSTFKALIKKPTVEPEINPDSMLVSRKAFYDTIRSNFGKLTQSQVDGLEQILHFADVYSRFADPVGKKQLAYILATIKHETADTYKPVLEYLSDTQAEANYGYKTAKGRVLGNTQQGDGAKYKGAGYVQVTGKNNAEKLHLAFPQWDFVTDFRALLLTPSVSFKAAYYGMSSGLFTGKKLADYINTKTVDYVGARRIINGNDKAELIAGYAKVFEEALDAKTSSD